MIIICQSLYYQYILDKSHFFKSPKTFRVIITIILCYFSFISKSGNRIDKNNNIADLNVSVKEISDVIQILHANKASEPDVFSHKMLKLCPSKIALP
jgi:hypothetical protein